MKNSAKIGLGVLSVSIAVAFGWVGWTTISHRLAVSDLVERTKADFVYVEGGTFDAGNYMLNSRRLDGTVEARWSIEPESSRPPTHVTLKSFYISAKEASAEDHALFVDDQNFYPPMDRFPAEDGSTAMTWAEARDYCAWLGARSGIALRLPTEDEWEYAARSGGALVAFATDDGEFRWGVNVQDNDRDTRKAPLGAFPPNPLGLFDMVEGAYEWVSDTAPGDPEGARVAKGSSLISSSFFETIPGRRISEPANPAQAELLGPRIQAMAERGPVHLAMATARCVSDVTEPPEVSGFGKRGGRFDPVPDAFGPYDRRNELIENQ